MRFGLLCPLVASVISLALGVAVSADSAPRVETTPIPTTTKPDWSSMKFLLGTWKCSTKSSRRPAAYTTLQVSAMDPTGRWMITDSINPKTSWSSTIHSVDKTTYDSDQHRWVDVSTSDQGGYDVTYSPGWKGDSMTWTDQLFTPGPDLIAVSQLTNIKVSDTKIVSHTAFKEKSGRTITVDGVCTKSS